MINPQKVRAMSRKIVFEQNEGRTVLDLKEYCEDEHIWKGLARSAMAGLILAAVALIVFILAAPSLARELYERMGDVWTVLAAAGILLVIAVIYSLISDAVFRKKYKSVRSTMSRYRSDIVLLDKLEQEQDKA